MSSMSAVVMFLQVIIPFAGALTSTVCCLVFLLHVVWRCRMLPYSHPLAQSSLADLGSSLIWLIQQSSILPALGDTELDTKKSDNLIREYAWPKVDHRVRRLGSGAWRQAAARAISAHAHAHTQARTHTHPYTHTHAHTHALQPPAQSGSDTCEIFFLLAVFFQIAANIFTTGLALRLLYFVRGVDGYCGVKAMPETFDRRVALVAWSMATLGAFCILLEGEDLLKTERTSQGNGWISFCWSALPENDPTHLKTITIALVFFNAALPLCCLLVCMYAYMKVWMALRVPIQINGTPGSGIRTRSVLRSQTADRLLLNSLRYIFAYFITWG
mmetsp:Transcript_34857/g.93145  ORF Transcript_34857/g.93145 Transcript_34857/m.93145 type:complete len:329 (+) Transcript_34857:203-1189(+)